MDTTTVKKAICSNMESVEAVECDTDIFSFLLHHLTHLHLGKSIFMSSVKLSKLSQQRITCRIQNFVEKITKSMASILCSLICFAGSIQSLV